MGKISEALIKIEGLIKVLWYWDSKDICIKSSVFTIFFIHPRSSKNSLTSKEFPLNIILSLLFSKEYL
ncbi:hypothetical protein SDC9_90348 [bioreactor metagenome]|uniref:Uncharacterized protein n=1 Tax=bioreactor metagenome TaxID=1076179 RepID=A0A644ZUW2_9ZZZZ